MRAAVITAPRQLEWSTLTLPDLAPGHLRVEVAGCGVCGSNVPVWEGRDWFSYPLRPGAPGHEAWGRVLQGSTYGRFPPGTRVAFLSDVAFAEIVDVPAAHAVPLPDTITGPFPGEALGCAFNVAIRAQFAPGQLVAVVGAGFLGVLVGTLAAQAGAEVVAVSRRGFALDLAVGFGAKHAVRVDDPADALGAVLGRTGGALCDVVVEAAGVQGTLDLAGALTNTRGRLVIAGYHQDSPRTVDMQQWNWRGIDVINAHERDDATRVEGIRAAVDAVAEGTLDPSPLYTHVLPPDRLSEALDAVVDRPADLGKAVMVR